MSSAVAAESIALDKVKTGILPSGGFYTLYEGTCPDKNVVSVASMERMRRWCINASGELACVRGSQEAVERACARTGLASNQDGKSLQNGQ
jgi:hypothetical protein